MIRIDYIHHYNYCSEGIVPVTEEEHNDSEAQEMNMGNGDPTDSEDDDPVTPEATGM